MNKNETKSFTTFQINSYSEGEIKMKDRIKELAGRLMSLPNEVFKPIEDDGLLYADNSDIVKDVEYLANELLISGGHPNFTEINLLQEYGFSVYEGDYDNSGWLTGVIYYPDSNKVLVFG